MPSRRRGEAARDSPDAAKLSVLLGREDEAFDATARGGHEPHDGANEPPLRLDLEPGRTALPGRVATPEPLRHDALERLA